MSTPVLRCERPRCDNAATHTATRVDALRDRWYLCDDHAIPQPSVFEPSPLWSDSWPPLSFASQLALFPPKHRDVSRRAARAIVDAAQREDTA
jgi:hypothetical protein